MSIYDEPIEPNEGVMQRFARRVVAIFAPRPPKRWTPEDEDWQAPTTLLTTPLEGLEPGWEPVGDWDDEDG